MILIVRSQFPLASAPSAGKAFVKVNTDKPLPSYDTRTGPYVLHALGIGVTTIEFHACPDDKMLELSRLISEQLVLYGGEISGYSAVIDVAMDTAEALKAVGQ